MAVISRTYGTLALSPDRSRWVLNSLEPHVALRLKQLFPKIPRGGTCPFYLPCEPLTAADLVWFQERYPLGMAPADQQALKDQRALFLQRQAELERIHLPTWKPPAYLGLRDGQVVRTYQAQAIETLRIRKSLLLGDEGGLGKTYTAAAFLCSELVALPAAVVVDAHMQKQWKEKIEDFTTLRVHLVETTKPYDLPEADVYIFRVSNVAGWVNIFAEGLFKSYIHDEPQSLRTGEGTAKGAACRVLYLNTRWHLGLTATPLYNYGDEMWNIMRFIDDEVLGARDDFLREWCSAIGNGRSRVRDPEALGTFLREQGVFIRRMKADVGLELPKFTRIIEHVEYDAKEVRAIEDLARALAIKATEGSFIERGQAARELDMMARQATGLAKAHSVAQFARLFCEMGEQVILWGWHRAVYDIWLAHFRGAGLTPALYTGTESPAQKERAKAAFIKREANPLIMSLRSGHGADGLQAACSVGIVGELDWSPMVLQQCFWRLDREGQKNPVTCFVLVTDDGADPPMMEVNGLKAAEATAIVDPHLGVQAVSADTTHMQALIARYLGGKK